MLHYAARSHRKNLAEKNSAKSNASGQTGKPAPVRIWGRIFKIGLFLVSFTSFGLKTHESYVKLLRNDIGTEVCGEEMPSTCIRLFNAATLLLNQKF